jgi:hypothetical protein
MLTITMTSLHMVNKNKHVINVKERQMGKLKALVSDHGLDEAQKILDNLRILAKMEKKYSIKEIKEAVDIAVGDDGRRSEEVIDILTTETSFKKIS